MHNCHVSGSENPSEATEHERHSPEVNVWFPVVKHIISLLFLEEPRAAAEKFLAVMEYTQSSGYAGLPTSLSFGLYSYAFLIVHDLAFLNVKALNSICTLNSKKQNSSFQRRLGNKLWSICVLFY